MLLAVGLCSGPAGAAAPTPVSSARTLYVGHSLINFDVPAIVQAMAESKGKTSRNKVQWYVGASMNYNLLHCRAWQQEGPWPPPSYACDEIDHGTDVGPFDALVITQSNNPIIHPSNPNEIGSTVEDFLGFLDPFLDKNGGTGRAYYYTSWEEQNYSLYDGADWTTRIAPELAKYEMTARLIEERERSTRGRSVSVPVIPINLALRDLILAAEAGNFPGVTNRSQLFVDGVHLTPLGYYLASCVVYASVFQESPAGATNRVAGEWSDVVNLDPGLAANLQNFAWNLVASYRGWNAAATRPRAPTGLIVR